jgi:hypothetical protein
MWTAPAAMFIESAADGWSKADPNMLTAEVKELNSFGSQRAQQMIASSSEEIVAALRLSNVSADFTGGYLLGLQVARTILMANPQLAIKGIKPDSLL